MPLVWYLSYCHCHFHAWDALLSGKTIYAPCVNAPAHKILEPLTHILCHFCAVYHITAHKQDEYRHMMGSISVYICIYAYLSLYVSVYICKYASLSLYVYIYICIWYANHIEHTFTAYIIICTICNHMYDIMWCYQACPDHSYLCQGARQIRQAGGCWRTAGRNITQYNMSYRRSGYGQRCVHRVDVGMYSYG